VSFYLYNTLPGQPKACLIEARRPAKEDVQAVKPCKESKQASPRACANMQQDKGKHPTQNACQQGIGEQRCSKAGHIQTGYAKQQQCGVIGLHAYTGILAMQLLHPRQSRGRAMQDRSAFAYAHGRVLQRDGCPPSPAASNATRSAPSATTPCH